MATDVNLDDAIGEDVVAVEMRLEDMMREPTSQYSPEYLYKCRKRLCEKVEYYRMKLEKSQSTIAKLVLKHREELESVRHFYQTIAYARTRTGAMIKTVAMNSPAAVTIMKELDRQTYSTCRK